MPHLPEMSGVGGVGGGVKVGAGSARGGSGRGNDIRVDSHPHAEAIENATSTRRRMTSLDDVELPLAN
jgi:hypothetical protein